MSASETLRQQNDVAWQACANHPFCTELADGSLPLDKMRGYLVQDYTFVDAFVRLAASAIAHAPTLADSVPLAQFLAVVTGPENTYFLRSFDALDVPEADRSNPNQWPETTAFQNLMKEAISSGDYAQMITVLTVVEWVYLSWATPVNPPKDNLPFYFSEWITLHAGDGFESVIAHLRDQLDKIYPHLEPAHQAKLAGVFKETVSLELDFFNKSYT